MSGSKSLAKGKLRRSATLVQKVATTHLDSDGCRTSYPTDKELPHSYVGNGRVTTSGAIPTDVGRRTPQRRTATFARWQPIR
ncbi:MAG: hypothetical protein Q4D93_06775 [Porphyromonas sp.]|nr:hypothetical protein [Porphyromonas sp.]